MAEMEPRDICTDDGGGDVGSARGILAWQLRRAGEEVPLASGEGPRLVARMYEEPMFMDPPDEEEEDELRSQHNAGGEGEWSDIRGLVYGR
jgi:hypothetical protein